MWWIVLAHSRYGGCWRSQIMPKKFISSTILSKKCIHEYSGRDIVLMHPFLYRLVKQTFQGALETWTKIAPSELKWVIIQWNKLLVFSFLSCLLQKLNSSKLIMDLWFGYLKAWAQFQSQGRLDMFVTFIILCCMKESCLTACDYKKYSFEEVSPLLSIIFTVKRCFLSHKALFEPDMFTGLCYFNWQAVCAGCYSKGEIVSFHWGLYVQWQKEENWHFGSLIHLWCHWRGWL